MFAVCLVTTGLSGTGRSPEIFNGRNQPDVDSAFVQKLRTTRGQVEAHLEPGRAFETVDVGARVEVPHRAEAHPSHFTG